MSSEVENNIPGRNMVIEGLQDEPNNMDPSRFKHNNEGMEEEAKQ